MNALKTASWTRAAAMLVASCCFAFCTAQAKASFTVYTATGSDGDGNLNAKAEFTLGSGTLSVKLTNLQANPTAAGQEISGIAFTLSVMPSSVSGAGDSGQLINVNTGNGTYANTSGNPDRWEASGHITQPTTTSIKLLVLGGGMPSEMIIGPPDGSNKYSNANASIGNFNPSVFETGTFNLNVGGITMDTQVTAATFFFGTGPDGQLDGTKQPPVTTPIPEPSTLALVLAGVAGIGLGGVRKLRRAV